MPGAGLAGISGVESGKAAPLVGGPPGIELHTVVESCRAGTAGDMVPVVLPTIGVGMVPSGVPGIIAVDGVIVLDGSSWLCSAMAMEVGTINGGGTDGAAIGPAAAVLRAAAAAVQVEPGITDMNDAAGCADSANGGGALAAMDVGVADVTVGAAEINGVVAAAPANTEIEVTGTVGVRRARSVR